jgi:hypothetical protein
VVAQLLAILCLYAKKSYRTYLGAMLPPDNRIWQLIDHFKDHKCINDASRVLNYANKLMPQSVLSLTIFLYGRNMFIVQATWRFSAVVGTCLPLKG